MVGSEKGDIFQHKGVKLPRELAERLGLTQTPQEEEAPLSPDQPESAQQETQTPSEKPAIPPRFMAGRKKPAVCLSDYKDYKTIELPKKTLKDQDEEGTIRVWDPELMNAEQATRAALELIHRGILEQNRPISNLEDKWIGNYITRIEALNDQDPRIAPLRDLKTAVFTMMNIIHRKWKGTEGAKGAKAHGAQDMISALAELQDYGVWFLFQDVEIEKAMHRIRGAVSDEFFRSGADESIRGERGEIYGGDLGSAEKLGYYLRLISMLGGLDESGEVASASYTAFVLLHPLEYFDKGIYRAYREVLEGEHFALARDENGKLTKELLYTYDTKLAPSAFHDREFAGIIGDPENFKPEKIGWQNIGRMLSLLDGPIFREQRRKLLIKSGGRPVDGVYEFHQFLVADEDTQIKWAKAAFELFTEKNEMEKKLGLTRGEAKKLRDRIIKVNLRKAYYIREKDDEGNWAKKRYSLFDYDSPFEFEVGDGDKVERRDFVDIGAMSTKEWGKFLTKTFLNAYWVNVKYAYDFQDNVLDQITQADPLHLRERLKAIFAAMTAKDGLRHLSETTHGADAPLEERGEDGPLVELGYERQKSINHILGNISRIIELSIYNDRKRGRERLPWAENVNTYMNIGYEAPRYQKEFESCGIYGRSWIHLMYQPLTEHQKVAKLLGKFERPEVWKVWLKKNNVTSLLEDRLGPLIGEDKPDVPQEWQDIGFAPDEYWDYLAYNALVSFAGYKVKRAYVDDDPEGMLYFYNKKTPRVEFELDFELGKENQRDPGRYWKENILPDNLSDEQKEQAWEDVIYQLMGYTRTGEAQKYGQLTEPTFSPLLYFYEKMHEEAFIDILIEEYLQETFDKDEANWNKNRWGKFLMHKKRWDAWALIRRQMKYTVGVLLEGDKDDDDEMIKKGSLFVHDQIGLEVKWDPETRRPRYTGKIEVDDKGLPTMQMSAISSGGKGWDRVSSMALGSVGVWRPPENLMSAPIHFQEITRLETRLQDAKRAKNKNLVKRLQRQIEAEKEKDLLESVQRSHIGLGDAGEEKQLSWIPTYYYKYMMMNFWLSRLFDPAYRYEQAINAGENWEDDQCYLDVSDPKQRREFFDYLEKIGEDHGWIQDQKERLGIDEAAIGFFQEEKSRLMIRDIRGELETTPDDEESMSMQKRILSISKLDQVIPLLRSGRERTAFFTGLGLVAVPLWTIGGITGALATAPFTWLFGPALAGIILGASFMDRKPTKEGRENTKKGGPLGLLTKLGTRVFHPPFIIGNFSLGIVGKRMQSREAKNIATGWSPVWDSAIPWEEIIKTIDEYKKKLVEAQAIPT